MKTFRSNDHSQRTGMALVIILAFVVLLSVLVTAYFSRAVVSRRLSDSSLNLSKTKELALSATNLILSDLRREIQDPLASDATTVGTGAGQSTIYTPTEPKYMLPLRNVSVSTPDPFPNLIRISKASDPIAAPGIGSKASAVNSVDHPSLNGRLMTTARWNSHFLIETTDPTDPSSRQPKAFEKPDWVLVTYDEGTKVNPDLSKVVGRYAYAIYDEGGLLDVNAAGYPSPSVAQQFGSKLALPYADLTQIGLTQQEIDNLVGWRNYATTEQSPDFGNFTFTTNQATKFYGFVASNDRGFLRVPETVWNSRTDQVFPTRQSLLAYRWATSPSASTAPLQYLTHFSRSIEQPSYVPPVHNPKAVSPPEVLAEANGGNTAHGGDKLINPNFLGIRVETEFTRNDGTSAKVGDPLVNKRFALNRLSWVTYKGPSASRNQGDADIQAIISAGIPWTYLQQGTAENIEKHFGLTWDSGKDRWLYDTHRGTSGGNRIIKLVGRSSGGSSDAARYVQDSGREPDFFELLKAGISVGSLAKAAVTSSSAVSAVPSGYAAAEVPANMRYNFDSSVDYHIMQVGANILSAVNPTSFPVRIVFDDGSPRGAWEFQGVTDLPYLSYVFNGVLRNQAPVPAPVGGGAIGAADEPDNSQYPLAQLGTVVSPGKAYAIQVPAVWNPYDPNGTASVARPGRYRVLIDSNDPLSLAAGGTTNTNHPVWCAGEGSQRMTRGGWSNEGLTPPAGVASFQATTGATSTDGVPVSDAVTFNDAGGSLFREPTLIFSTLASAGGASRAGGNITSLDANPLPRQSDGSKGPWAPLVIGEFPLAFNYTIPPANGNPAKDMVVFTGTAAIGHGGQPIGQALDNRVYFTYRLQYEYPAGSGNWVTYDTKYSRTTHGLFSFQGGFRFGNGAFSPSVIKGPGPFNPFSWASAIDPRTARFGMVMQVANMQRCRAYFCSPPAEAGWCYGANGAPSTAQQGITFTPRPDYVGGFEFRLLDYNDPNLQALNSPGLSPNQSLTHPASNMRDVPFPAFAAGWTRSVTHSDWTNVPLFAPGMYAQNNPATPFNPRRSSAMDTIPNNLDPTTPAYYADADGVVRRAAGAYVPRGNDRSALTTVGLPTAGIQGFQGQNAIQITPATKTPFSQSQSRPLLLHRPFRSVAELGYVFRDVPWKNLDFFTPESGDAALLDLFCIQEVNDPNSLVAGKVNLNTRQASVITAVVNGAYVDDPKVSNATVGTVAAGLSQEIAKALTARTADVASYGPLQNISELVGKWNGAVAISSGTTYTHVFAAANAGVDLPMPEYKDGRASFVGFSGAVKASGGGTKINLTDAYATISDAKLKTSMSNVQRFREAPIRALSNAGQTRVWNLMIDLVAQTGRYPRGQSNLAKFSVDGEQRYWVHVAIDRMTGTVIDKQVEVVRE